MDPITNPFSPGAGSPPPELVGRDLILEQARILFGRIKQKRAEKSMLLTGLRGVGKTVLLNEINELALQSGYRTALIEAHEEKGLKPVIIPYLRRLLFDMDRLAGVSSKVKRSLAVLRSFIGTVKVTTTVNDVTFGIDLEPERGSADSGDLDIDLTDLFVAIGEAAEERQCPIAILIDEIQYFDQNELGALIMAMHKVQQRQLPVVLLGAGLPILPGLAGESKSYAERLFSFPDVGALSREDAIRALRDPAQSCGVDIEDEALQEIFNVTKGYPYFLQEWGYQAWNMEASSLITFQTVQAATTAVIARLDQNFFRVRYDRLTPGEKEFLRVMAELGANVHRVGDIAQFQQVKVSSLSTVRANLIKKGMIYSPAYGEIAFSVPLFDQFMIRAMPAFSYPA